MPRKNSTTWAVSDPMTAVRLNKINADFDDLYANGDDRGRIWEAISWTPLKIDIASFGYKIGNSNWIYAGGTDIAVTDAATNYVEIDSAGAIQINTTSWNSANARLWIVTASGGAITSIVIWKPDVVGGEFWAAAFNFDYPHAKANFDRFAAAVSDLSGYTPPAWKVAYITIADFNGYQGMKVNGILIGEYWYAAGQGRVPLDHPLIVDDTDILLSNQAWTTWYIAGFLVDEDVDITPVQTAGAYTVPAWKYYIITQMYYISSGTMVNMFTINSVTYTGVASYNINTTDLGEGTGNLPILGPGDTVNFTSLNHAWYLVPTTAIS